jgi:uncharacterized protein (TIGR03435 family)
VAAVKVRPEGRDRDPIGFKCENGRLTVRNDYLSDIVSWAFDLQPSEIVLPSWAEGPAGPTYDIDAKAADPVPREQVKLMLQRLLADRFQFAAHHEMRQGVHRVLRVGKGGPKLKEAAAGAEGTIRVKSDLANFRIICRGATLAEFLFRVWSMGTERERIYDQTGLTGRYDFTLDYANYIEDSAPERRLNALQAARIDAIRAELGLEVVDARISVDTLVVDRVEKIPTEN